MQGPLTVEAIDRVEVSIPSGAVDQEVALQPGPVEAVELLVIKCSEYSDKVSYMASDGTADSPSVALLGPHLFTGGSVALLGLDPNVLKFSNASANAVQIEIFVARDATP